MRKTIVIVGTLFILSIVLFSLSLHYRCRIEKDEGRVSQLPSGIKKVTPREKKRKLCVSDPAEYGMVVINEYNRPQTQKEWDILISQKIDEAKAQLPQDALEKITNKIKEDPQKTAEKIKMIDENIQKCQEILKSDPTNKEVRDRLERLKILKSISQKLP